MITQRNVVYFLFFMILCTTNDCTEKETNYTCKPNGFLRFLYTSPAGSIMRPFITSAWFSKAAGWYADSRLSTMHIKSFIKKHAIPMHEATRSNPNQYHSFNDFFTRTLKPEARPIDTDPNTIVSPADGTLFVFEHIGPQTEIFAKSKLFDLATFLADSTLAQHFYDGTIIIIYLSPWNYHRFHMPLDAVPSAAKAIHGRYESVNPLVYQAGKQPLQENERKRILLKTVDNKSIAFVCVGALCVGRISYTYKPETLYKKGQELGYFSLGGSTIVLVFEKDMITIDSNLYKHQKDGQPIKMGEKIGTFR